MEEIAAMIRREISMGESRKEKCGYAEWTMGDVALRFEIAGMRKILALFDPNPHS